MKRFSLVAALLMTAAISMWSQTEWKLDKAHSSVSFSIKHLVISTVTGNFKDYDISLSAKKADFSDAVLVVVRYREHDLDQK